MKSKGHQKDNRMLPASYNILRALPIKPDAAVRTTFLHMLFFLQPFQGAYNQRTGPKL